MSLKPPTCPKCGKFEFQMGRYGDNGICRCAEKGERRHQENPSGIWHLKLPH